MSVLRSTHVAILRRRDNPSAQAAVIMPPGSTIQFDPGTSERAWLKPYLTADWQVHRFIELLTPLEETT